MISVLHTLLHRLPMLFSDQVSPLNCSFPQKILIPIQYMVPSAHLNQPSKRHLDRFSRFCTACPCAQHTHRQTGTQTTLHATSVAIGRIYLLQCLHSITANAFTECYMFVTILTSCHGAFSLSKSQLSDLNGYWNNYLYMKVFSFPSVGICSCFY